MGPGIGLRGQATVRVTGDRTAQALGSGDLAVFATPAMGRNLIFTIVAHDQQQKIGEGLHQRMIVARDRFLAKLSRGN
jgi:predicted thioesterase